MSADGMAALGAIAQREIDRLEAEVTRLRAVLESIAALQTEEPVPSGSLQGADAYADGLTDGEAIASWKTASMARAGLVSPVDRDEPPECTICGRAMGGINAAGMCPECAR